MATLKFILYTSKKLHDGTYPVMLRLTKLGQRKYISLGYSATKVQWDNITNRFIKDKRVVSDHVIRNGTLEIKELRARQILNDFESTGLDYSLTQFEEKFINELKQVSIGEYYNEHVKKLKKDGRFGYATAFDDTLNSLKSFDGKFDSKSFNDIDFKYVSKYEKWLKDRNIKDTSVSVRMRTLRALLNSAIKDGKGCKDAFPFSDKYGSKLNVYKISSLDIRTKKRHIPIQYLQKIRKAAFIEPHLELTRRIFLFSFYTYGMPYYDMANLTKTNICSMVLDNGDIVKTIEYSRQKTHREHTKIIINSEIQELLNWFHTNYELGEHLIPIVTRPKLQGEERNDHIINRRKRYNKYLKTMTEKLEFPKELDITGYFARHSYAMALRNKGVSIELISEALGHANLKTTAIYLDSFGTNAIAEISKNLL